MSLEVLLGPMFAGKSSAILQKVNRYRSLGWAMCIISHASDSRYSDEPKLMNHDKWGIPCEKWSSLLPHIGESILNEAKFIVIDEAQFFPDLKEFVEYLVDHIGKDVLIVGLDGDADRKPFGQVLDCIPLADKVMKLSALCKECGDGTEAIFTFCKKPKEKTEQVLVGGAEMYVPLCRKHFLLGTQEQS
jgi:thymidine kinase